MSRQEALAYNTIATAARLNVILTTKMEGRTSAWQDSLLNPAQYKFALQMMQNIRLACCGGSRVCPTLTAKFFEETIHQEVRRRGLAKRSERSSLLSSGLANARIFTAARLQTRVRRGREAGGAQLHEQGSHDGDHVLRR